MPARCSPSPSCSGVDLIIPDLSYLESRRGLIKGFFLTHGHEDHIGAVPYVLPLVDGPLYGTPLALAFVQSKLEEHGIARAGITPIKPGDVITVGPLRSSSFASRTACRTAWPSSCARLTAR
jgi:ribonuclease J